MSWFLPLTKASLISISGMRRSAARSFTLAPSCISTVNGMPTGLSGPYLLRLAYSLTAILIKPGLLQSLVIGTGALHRREPQPRPAAV